MPGIDFKLLRDELNMEEVLDALGWVATRRGGPQLRGPCPVHGSGQGSESLSVNLESGRYFCHKCKSHGHQLELWAAVHRQTIFEAAQDLCRALQKEIPWITRW
jgi:DNA primase